MKVIKDIRLYKSEMVTEYGEPIVHSFGDKKLNALIHRIVMKLREGNFSLGEFDHLYINFTICDMEELIELSDEVDKYHSWYRICSIKVDKDLYDKLGSPEAEFDIVGIIGSVLDYFFSTEIHDTVFIHSCIKTALDQGENMLMKFKVKASQKFKAIIYLRYLDNCKYLPLLKVFDKKENLLLEKDLPETLTLDYLGDIGINRNNITIKPRKNAFTAGMKPIVVKIT